MSVSFPLVRSAFANLLHISALSQRPGWQQEWSGLGNGGGISADVAPALRQYDVTLAPMARDDADQIMAMIEAVSTMNAFEIGDPRRAFPQYDPDGSLLSGSTVRIHSLNVNNKAMSLAGLPSGYTVTQGDLLSWSYSSNPARRAYHRVIETKSASGGNTAEFEVRDFIRPGSTTGLTVSLINPSMLAKMVKDSLKYDDSASDFLVRISFTVRQVL